MTDLPYPAHNATTTLYFLFSCDARVFPAEIRDFSKKLQNAEFCAQTGRGRPVAIYQKNACSNGKKQV